ncbi:O-antigen ligase family protein [Vibrio mimicus]|nr:O-antigen ligase [Vibrio mimicus]QXC56790.1 O-antigen ligase family protein [Vibrio mimicus]
MTSFKKILFFAFLLFVFWLPIPLGSNRPWAWSLNEIYAAALLLACVVAIPAPQWWQAIKRAKAILLPVALFTVWSWLQSWPRLNLSADPGLVLISAVKSLHYLQICLIASLVIDTPHKVKMLATTMIASGVCQAFYAGVVLLLELHSSPIFSLPLNQRASGSFVYHNHLANFLMLNLCLGFGLLIAQLSHQTALGWKGTLKKLMSLALSDKAFIRLGLVIMVIALVLTRSRMGNMAFFIALSIGCVLLLLFYRHKPKSIYILIVSLFVIDAFVVSHWFGLDKVRQRLVETSLESESRDDVVRYALQAIQDRPLTGFGNGTFYSTFPAYNQGNVALFYDHAHNDYVQFALESGLVATGLLGIMVLFCVWQAFRAFRLRSNATMRGIGLGSLMAIIGMLQHMSVDFPLQAPATTLYFLFCLLLANWSSTIPTPRHSRLRTA